MHCRAPIHFQRGPEITATAEFEQIQPRKRTPLDYRKMMIRGYQFSKPDSFNTPYLPLSDSTNGVERHSGIRGFAF
jgi:hypothetical protein